MTSPSCTVMNAEARTIRRSGTLRATDSVPLHCVPPDGACVMINGIARYGPPDVMQPLAPSDQTVRVGGQTRRLFLTQETADPDVAQGPLSTATTTLREALHDIAKLAKETEKPRPAGAIRRVLDARAAPVWTLAGDEIFSSGVELNPRLPFGGPGDFTGPERPPPPLAKPAPPRPS